MLIVGYLWLLKGEKWKHCNVHLFHKLLEAAGVN